MPIYYIFVEIFIGYDISNENRKREHINFVRGKSNSAQ